jgi:hypothetical protein
MWIAESAAFAALPHALLHTAFFRLHLEAKEEAF